jgi:hypothetical protein
MSAFTGSRLAPRNLVGIADVRGSEMLSIQEPDRGTADLARQVRQRSQARSFARCATMVGCCWGRTAASTRLHSTDTLQSMS